jgi:exodeoxyribonuclease VII large subunit
MTRRLPLSALAALIEQTVEQVFADESFWIIAEIADVKKYEAKRWCFLKFIEKKKDQVFAEMQGIFWANAYQEIIRFERSTGQLFTSGIEISCRVQVKFHPRYGLKLEVQEIDTAFTLGQIELQRQQTLDQLLRKYPSQIKLEDGVYLTPNKQLKWPKVMQRVALIGAEGSDGHRDFLQELLHNQYGYVFKVSSFHSSVQGQQAVADLCAQLDTVHQIAAAFDVVAIVRGGGSNTDFAAFDDFEVARRIAFFPIPVFTGIGHDRNTSIADMMAWQFKTPTKVASAIVDTALHFESQLMLLKDQLSDTWLARTQEYAQQLKYWDSRMQHMVPFRLQRRFDRLSDWQHLIERTARDEIKYHTDQLAEKAKRLQQQIQTTLKHHQLQLQHVEKLVAQLSPASILNRGYAMVMQGPHIITDARQLDTGQPMQTVLKNQTITSDIKAINEHEQKDI